MMPTDKNDPIAQLLAKRAPQALGAAPVGRSQYLTRALQQMQADEPQIRSGAELGTRLLAQAVTKFGADRAFKNEQAEAERLKAENYAKALETGRKLRPGDEAFATAYAENPEVVLRNWAEQYKPQTLSGGQTAINVAGGHFTAPEFVRDGGQFFTQTAEGVTKTGARDPSIAEQETAKQNQFDRATGWMPEGMRPEIGPDGTATGDGQIDPEYRDFAVQRAASGATRVNVPITLPAQNEFAKAFAGQYAASLTGARDQADSARNALNVLERINNTVDNSNTGLLAGPAQMRDRALAAFGDTDASQRAANTQQLESDMNSLVLPLVKQLGSSNSITNADREFIAKIVGTKDLTPQAIKRITEIQRRDAEAKISRYQALGQEAYQAVPPAQGLPPSAFGRLPSAPTAPPPALGGNAPAGTMPPAGAPKRLRYDPSTGRVE